AGQLNVSNALLQNGLFTVSGTNSTLALLPCTARCNTMSVRVCGRSCVSSSRKRNHDHSPSLLILDGKPELAGVNTSRVCNLLRSPGQKNCRERVGPWR